MVQALRRGDRVVTSGGIVGQVTKVLNDAELQVEIAEGVRVRVVRTAVNEVLSKTAPAAAADRADADDAAEHKKGGNLRPAASSPGLRMIHYARWQSHLP